MDAVETYARQVVDGALPAGKYHRLSCARHLRDLARQNTAGFPYRFDWNAAERFLRFARLMKHYKGPLAGKYFEPTPSQVFRLGSLFGWRHVDTGLRRFTVSYNDLPRKHGKSFEGAIVLTYCAFYEGEAGAEGYCIATKEKQAKDIVFANVKQLVRVSGLSSRLQINAANVNDPRTVSKAEPLGSDSKTTDGLSPHVVIVDELHAMQSRDLVDVMESATGARVNPLFFFITTHGDDIVSVWGDYLTYAQNILDGVLEDDPSTLSFFAFIAHADVGDDPFAESTWIKANPHWGGSVQIDDFRQQAAKAQQMPSAAAEFKQKKLNLLPDGISLCLSAEGWRKGQNPAGLSKSAWLAELEHQPCFVGIDLASKIDLCCCSLVFPPTPTRAQWKIIQHIWTPAETLAARARRDRAPYQVWCDQQWLTPTPGTRIDHQLIRGILKAAREIYDIDRIGFDPWHADTLIRQLIDEDGFPETQVLEIPQTFAGMSSACLNMQAEILSGSVDARGCPVTAWSVSNCVDQRDGKDNMMFVKKKSRGRIDPVIAPTIGMALALRFPADPAADDPILVTA